MNEALSISPKRCAIEPEGTSAVELKESAVEPKEIRHRTRRDAQLYTLEGVVEHERGSVNQPK